MRKKTLLIFSILFLTACTMRIEGGQPQLQTTQLRVNDTTVSVEIADETHEQTQGLSRRSGLKSNNGMLFIFPEKEERTFWMKDMNFPLDVLWIADGEVVSVSNDVQPPSGGHIPRMYSYVPADMVLEVGADFIEMYEISIGDRVDIDR